MRLKDWYRTVPEFLWDEDDLHGEKQVQREEQFINKVAQEVIAELSDEDKECMHNNPEHGQYHFGLGLYIRNKYIHGKELGFVHEPDELSGEIIDTIITVLKKETSVHK